MKKTINAFDLKDLKEEMKKEGIKYLTDFNNSAVKGMSNFSGISILINSTGESVFYQCQFEPVHQTELKHYSGKELKAISGFFDECDNSELYAGFEVPGYDEPFLLNEFIRTNYHG